MICYIYERTGQVIANFIEEMCVLKVEEKLDHVDAEAQVEHERMDNNAKGGVKNERMKISRRKCRDCRKADYKDERQVAACENLDFSYHTIESARKYVNKISYVRSRERKRGRG